jgi:YD repeat-containing protein
MTRHRIRTGFTDPEGGTTDYTYDTLIRLTALAVL